LFVKKPAIEVSLGVSGINVDRFGKFSEGEIVFFLLDVANSPVIVADRVLIVPLSDPGFGWLSALT